MKIAVRKGARYRARVHLGLFEQVATDDQIADKLRSVGFSNVTVMGSGRDRWAFGNWTGEDMTVDLDDHLRDVTELA